MKITSTKFDLKQKLNKRETLIFLATILAGMLGFYKSCVVSGLQEISNAKQKIESLQNDRAQLIAQASSQKQKQPIGNVGRKQWLADKDTVNRSLNGMTHPNYTGRIKIQEIKLSEVQEKDSPFITKHVSLTFSGNFSGIGEYLEYLESLPAPLIIDSISIAHDGTTLSNLIAKIEGGFHVSTQK